MGGRAREIQIKYRIYGANIDGRFTAPAGSRFSCLCGQTPFMLACKNGHTKLAALLLEKQAELDATDTTGRTALQLSCSFGQQESVQFLRTKGASFKPSADGFTVLMAAASGGLAAY